LALLTFAFRASIPRRGLLLAGAALIAASRTLAGHAASHEPRLVLAPALFVHLAVAAFWLGSLIALSRALQRSPSTALAWSAGKAIGRFSTCASVAVPLLLVAGGAMSFNYVWGSESPFASTYTWLLIAKGVLFLALLGLAVLNRQSLVPTLRRRLADGTETDASTGRSLLRSMRAEVVLIIVTVAVSTVLATTPPPARSKSPVEAPAGIAATAPRVARLEIQGDAVRLELEVAPARAGSNEVRLRFFDSAGKPRDLVEASVELSLAARAIEGMVTRAERESPGVFVAHDVRVPFAGDWDLAVQALITDFDKETLRSRIQIDR
jgi:copper transport protein